MTNEVSVSSVLPPNDESKLVCSSDTLNTLDLNLNKNQLSYVALLKNMVHKNRNTGLNSEFIGSTNPIHVNKALRLTRCKRVKFSRMIFDTKPGCENIELEKTMLKTLKKVVTLYKNRLLYLELYIDSMYQNMNSPNIAVILEILNVPLTKLRHLSLNIEGLSEFYIKKLVRVLENKKDTLKRLDLNMGLERRLRKNKEFLRSLCKDIFSGMNSIQTLRIRPPQYNGLPAFFIQYLGEYVKQKNKSLQNIQLIFRQERDDIDEEELEAFYKGLSLMSDRLELFKMKFSQDKDNISYNSTTSLFDTLAHNKFPNLRSLIVDVGYFSSIVDSDFEEFRKIKPDDFPNLEHFELSIKNKECTDLSLQSLSEALGKLYKLKRLSLSFGGETRITETGLDYLSKAFDADLMSLRRLEISFEYCDFDFTQVHFQAIISLVQIFARTLQHLKLNVTSHYERRNARDNTLMDDNFSLDLKELQSLDLSLDQSSMLGVCIKSFNQSLYSSPAALKELIIYFRGCENVVKNNITDIIGILNAQKETLERVSLDFSGCRLLTDKDLEAISKSLTSKTSRLKFLKLILSECTGITDIGVGAIFEYIESIKSHLECLELDLYECSKVSDTTLKNIGRTLRKEMSCLKRFKLSIGKTNYYDESIENCSDISNEGIESLCKTIYSKCSDIEELEIGVPGCKISPKKLQWFIEEICRACKSLKMCNIEVYTCSKVKESRRTFLPRDLDVNFDHNPTKYNVSMIGDRSKVDSTSIHYFKMRSVADEFLENRRKALYNYIDN